MIPLKKRLENYRQSWRAVLLLGGIACACAVQPTPGWIGLHFNVSQPAQPYFSFLYNKQHSTDFLAQWKVTTQRTQLDENRLQQITEYTDPTTGLQVRSTAIIFQDFPAVDWVLHFTNTGKDTTPILEQILPLDAAVVAAGATQFVLHTNKGDLNSAESFRPAETLLPPDTTVVLTAQNGRSSSYNYMPFFNLAWQNHGVAVALGWTGQWQAKFSVESPDSLKIQGGMQYTHMKLFPGETIRTPRMLLAFWDGAEAIDGNNLMRRLFIKHYLPRKDGKLVWPPICGSVAEVAPDGTYEEPHLRAMPIYAERGLEVFWSDMDPQHWYPIGFPDGTGTWKPDPAKYPNGLGPIGDAAHQAGLGYLLWFEPERAVAGTEIDQLHPEWLTKIRVAQGNKNFLFRLDLPEARAWLLDLIDEQIIAAKIDWFRQDFNIDPLDYWLANDAPDRVGITEIRHIEGLYAFWDELVRRHPNLAIDNCASGGRRFDLETLSRSYQLWHSDLQCLEINPEADQLQNGGLYRWIPLHGCGNYGYEPSYNFRSALASGVIFTVTNRDTLTALRRNREAANVRQRSLTMTSWSLVGPFPAPKGEAYDFRFPPEEQVDLNQVFEGGRLMWEQRPDWFDGERHQFEVYEPYKVTASYLYREITAAQAMPCRVYFGSNDGFKVWVNGQFLQGVNIGRGIEVDADTIDLPLKRGKNTLLFKIVNLGNTTGFYFSTMPFPADIGWERHISADPQTEDAVKRSVEMYKKMRPYLLGDFYPLFPHLTHRDVWYGYQFHRPEFDDGAIVLFRRKNSPEPIQKISVQRLDPGTKYEFSIHDTGEQKIVKGGERLPVEISEAPGSRIIFYQRKR